MRLPCNLIVLALYHIPVLFHYSVVCSAAGFEGFWDRRSRRKGQGMKRRPMNCVIDIAMVKPYSPGHLWASMRGSVDCQAIVKVLRSVCVVAEFLHGIAAACRTTKQQLPPQTQLRPSSRRISSTLGMKKSISKARLLLERCWQARPVLRRMKRLQRLNSKAQTRMYRHISMSGNPVTSISTRNSRWFPLHHTIEGNRHKRASETTRQTESLGLDRRWL